MLKENIPPLTRQGQFFRLNLLSNLDEGPFLKKDIMQNNKKSIILLTGKGVLQNLTNFNKSMMFLDTKTKQISTLYPQNVDNIYRSISHCQSQLQIIDKQSNKLKKEQKVLKSQMQKIFERQKQSNKQLYESCMPLLKKLFKTVRQVKNKQKDQYHLMERSLVQMETTKKAIVQGILECQARIISLQHVIGYKTGDVDEVSSVDA